jgi:hypothetical protein
MKRVNKKLGDEKENGKQQALLGILEKNSEEIQCS